MTDNFSINFQPTKYKNIENFGSKVGKMLRILKNTSQASQKSVQVFEINFFKNY